MFGYYLRLALKSFARDPSLTALMVLAIGLGIGVCVMTLTVYHAVSSNPIWWKSDRLYAVTMDSWTPERPANREKPGFPPTQLTYTDATYLSGSTIPERKTLMYLTTGVVVGGAQVEPIKLRTRFTTADFFPMFDVPFQFGAGWNAQADNGPEPVVVLSNGLNQQLFGGANSVGRTIRWGAQEFRIIGVLRPWMPQPKFYDLTGGKFEEPEPVYLPWGWGKALRARAEQLSCWKFEKIDTFDQVLGSECVWVNMWVELPDAASRERMQTVLDTYWAQQHAAGRFPRARDNRLTNVGQWLKDNDVVENDDRLLVGLAFAFLGVCLLNTVGLLLAKFLNGAPVAGIRRALGASRLETFTQHLVYAGVLAFAGALVGLGLSVLFLRGVRVLYGGDPDAGAGGYQALAHFDTLGIAYAIGLALAALVIAGVYPAWRIGLVPPANYLKSQ